MDLSEKLGRPVRFLAWNIAQSEVDHLASFVDEEKVDTDYIAADIFEIDVFIVSVKDEPAFKDKIAEALDLEPEKIDRVASGPHFLNIERYYETKEKVIRIVLFNADVFAEADQICRTAGLAFILLAGEPSELSGKPLKHLFDCEAG